MTQSHNIDPTAPKSFTALFLFVCGVLGCGLLIGTVTRPDQWYETLAKPSFNPPNWIFGPVWTLLYILIAVAGWRTWSDHPRGWPMRLWWTQLGLNFVWSPVFFIGHNAATALMIILSLLACIVGFVLLRWHEDKLSSLLFIPYSLWVAFASLLNSSIIMLN